MATDETVATEMASVMAPADAGEFPEVSINHEIINCLAKGWQTPVIIKLLGRPVAFHILERKLCVLWKPNGRFVIVDLPHEFSVEEDHFTTLTGGHWTVFGRCLMVRNWSAYFNPSRDSIKTCDWVCFTNLPLFCMTRGYYNTLLQALEYPLCR
ncbi:hypothetical protein V2J09_012700 [Rumex salicifolius]